MLRYLVVSAILVVGAAVLVAAWVNRDLIRVRIASVYVRTQPKAGASNAPEAPAALPLRGDAPWALSALPECLIQTSKSSGPLGYVLAHLPAGARPVVPPASLAYADCTIFVTRDEAYVRRGADRLRIPPRARFYRAPGMLVLLRQSPDGTEMRVYKPTPHDMTKR